MKSVYLVRFIYYITICTNVIAGVSFRNKIFCEENGVFPEGRLECFSKELINVEQLIFYSGTTCTSDDRIQCGRVLYNSNDGLSPNCTTKGSCTVTLPSKPSGCPDQVSITVNYRCVEDKVHDICESLQTSGSHDRLFFSTPGYPGLSPLDSPRFCRCDIKPMFVTSVSIIDLMFSADTQVLVLNGDSTVFNKTSASSPSRIYNERKSLEYSKSLRIIFNQQRASGAKLWIEVEGISMNATCGPAEVWTTTVSTSSPETTTASSLPSTSSYSSISPSTSTTSSSSKSTTISSPYTTSSSPYTTGSSPSKSTSTTRSSTISPQSTTPALDNRGISHSARQVCEKDDKFPVLDITCGGDGKINIETITYYSGSSCTFDNRAQCGGTLTNSSNGLAHDCNNRTFCGVYVPNKPKDCSGVVSATVNYRCISGTLYNICGSATIVNTTNRLFLSTPGYPQLSPFNKEAQCSCSIRGSSIAGVSLVDLVIEKSTVNIADGTGRYIYQEGDMNARKRLYNVKIPLSFATSTLITFQHRENSYQKLWIEVQGMNMVSECRSENITPISILPTTPTSPFPLTNPTTGDPGSFRKSSSEAVPTSSKRPTPISQDPTTASSSLAVNPTNGGQNTLSAQPNVSNTVPTTFSTQPSVKTKTQATSTSTWSSIMDDSTSSATSSPTQSQGQPTSLNTGKHTSSSTLVPTKSTGSASLSINTPISTKSGGPSSKAIPQSSISTDATDLNIPSTKATVYTSEQSSSMMTTATTRITDPQSSPGFSASVSPVPASSVGPGFGSSVGPVLGSSSSGSTGDSSSMDSVLDDPITSGDQSPVKTNMSQDLSDITVFVLVCLVALCLLIITAILAILVVLYRRHQLIYIKSSERGNINSRRVRAEDQATNNEIEIGNPYSQLSDVTRADDSAIYGHLTPTDVNLSQLSHISDI